ncbi:primase-helicase family protein [Undibacterium sp. Dicai25W]|uniref:primase-helicase family protein n=1 Tax=Undibacterium sp. Dicai25W TaxID=3413034 RepID=UPI003BEF7D7C
MNNTENTEVDFFDPFGDAPLSNGASPIKKSEPKSEVVGASGYSSMESEFALLRDLQEFRKKYAIINRSGKTFICWEDKNLQTLEFQNIVDFHYFHAHLYHFIPQEKAKSGKVREDKRVQVTQAFLEDKLSTRYEGIVFDPSETCGKQYWNLWRGFKVQPKQGDISLFMDLIAALCNDDQTCMTYLLNYLAHMVQKPAELPEVAIVMRGTQGIGKGSLMKTIGGFTDNYKQLSTSNSLTGQFNGHLLNAFIIFADEAVWGGDKSAEGRLKAMITEGTNSINDKGRQEIQVKNFSRIFVASNEEWCVPVGEEDRRFFVVDGSPRYKGKTKPGEFFSQYNEWIKNGGREAVFHALKTRDISSFAPRDFPNTKARMNLMIRSLPLPERFIYEVLNGSALVENKTIVKAPDGSQSRCYRNAFYADCLEWCKSLGFRFMPSADEMGKAMSKVFAFEQDNPNWRSNWKSKTQGYFYQLPSRTECMKRFAYNLCKAEPAMVFFDYEDESELKSSDGNSNVVNFQKQA